jgi:hypothetical protein
MKQKLQNYLMAILLTGMASNAQITGPSSSATPYLINSTSGSTITSLLSAGDAIGGYKFSGIPDGTGAFDNGDGNFTVLINHELGSTSGVARAHGAIGAFVSKWIIRKSDLTVLSGSDLIQSVYTWNVTTSSYALATTTFNRFCSADLPATSAFYNSVTGLGTQEKIFLNGEESGAEGRAFGHIVTGTNAGKSYELPHLGKYSWENAVANPNTNNKTIVAGTDDTTPGQVYMYIGTKTNTGTEIEKAGLKVETKPATEMTLPDELSAQFKLDPKFEAAFRSLTPGRQKGYIYFIADAKQSKTRESRIEKYRAHIMAGKGMMDR